MTSLISELSAFEFLKEKFKLNEADAKKAVIELVAVNERLDNNINEKIDEKFKDLKDVFMTKQDKADLLKETYLVRSDLEKSMRQHMVWTVSIGFILIGVLITCTNLILSRLPGPPVQPTAIHQTDTSSKK